MGHDFVDFPVNKFFQKHNAMTLHVLAICVRASQWWYVWYEVPRNVQPHVPGGGGTPHMKGVGILVVSRRGVNVGFWSRLGCSGQNAIIFSREGLV